MSALRAKMTCSTEIHVVMYEIAEKNSICGENKKKKKEGKTVNKRNEYNKII